MPIPIPIPNDIGWVLDELGLGEMNVRGLRKSALP
jgi:hypothetical protein